MTTLSTELLNTPDRILLELSKVKARIKGDQMLEAGLKQELENHFENKTINGKYSANGLTAIRAKREGKWKYSEFTDQYALKLKKDLEEKMAREREDGIAKQKDPTYYWTVRAEK